MPNSQPPAPPKTIEELRTDHERAKLTLETLQLQQTAKLMEWGASGSYTSSEYGGLVDPLDALRDGDTLYQPIRRPLQDLPKGGYRLETEEDRLREFVRVLVMGNPFAQSIVRNLRNFIIGSGFTYRATVDDEANQDLAEQAQMVIDEFLDVNLWPEKEQEILVRTVRDGEAFVRCFHQKDVAQIRFIEPTQIRTPNDRIEDPGWTYGIYIDPEDVGGEPTQYFVTYDEEQNRTEEVAAEEIVAFQVNKLSNEKRGVSEFYGLGEVLEGVRKLLRNMREGAALQAAIAGITQHQASSSTVQSFLDQKANYTQGQFAPGQKTNRYQKYEPGSWLHINAGQEYLDPPFWGKDTGNRVEVVQACIRMAGAAFCMPEYMISADSSNANYASTLVSGGPFVREAKGRQGWLRPRFLRVIWKVLYYACQSGRIDSSYDDLVARLDVQCEPPQVEIVNELEMAQVDQIDITSGVLSKQTRRQRRGLDDDQEVANLKEEPTAQPAPPTVGGAVPNPFLQLLSQPR